MKVTQSEAIERLIKNDEYTSCTEAFLDCRLPGAVPKGNYSIIGPGVTQSEHQVVNFREPHSFNIGAASMPNGVTNNLHIHFSAEVFMCTYGEYTFRWGSNGEYEYIAKEGDILSVPTWLFRGFTNTGPDGSWLFTCLGEDNTGGVIWHPGIMQAANESGMYLTKNNMLIDLKNGGHLPEDKTQLMDHFPESEFVNLRKVSLADMSQRVSARDNRVFSSCALLDSVIPGHSCEIAPVIGYGVSQDRNSQPPITNPHNFTIEVVKIPAGNEIGSFRIDEKMVIIQTSGEVEIIFNQEKDISITVGDKDTYSIPKNAWRTIANKSANEAEFIMITAGDMRKRPEFENKIKTLAYELGYTIDSSGYVVKANLIIEDSLLLDE
ncbi:hypothetical protein CXF72_12160 [Psychromonas sp. MB-3u-54]|uniref:hypothetical protein n=1 Tax=Psychromonas sp. MB-3u-54 TaxID=2058319 RepID=UPI000C325C49|nr:hypothetical protein [Psychromonas sp. MB-3u-54]PKH02332.1 hypothetical protein CXF72_12160 [Psychromonas sp. MB-3u-54]